MNHLHRRFIGGLGVVLTLFVASAVAQPQTLYVAREQPPVYRVISESPYYAQPVYVEPTYVEPAYGAYGRVQGRRWSAQVGYSAPVSTTVQQNIRVIAPPNTTVVVEEQHYPVYPVINPYVYQRRVEVVTDPQATPNRAKQWTDKSDMAP